MKRLLLLLLISLSLSGYLFSQLSVSPYFSSNMVLQRNTSNRIHGKSTPGDKVSVTINGYTKSTKASSAGEWSADLPAFTAGGPYELKISNNKDAILLENILFGDVWLCSGQSNMEYKVGMFPWAHDASAKSLNNKIRFIEIPNSIDEVPLRELPSNIEWTEAVGNNILQLSATSYWFATHLQPEINVPIGLIVADWSGTAIEPWMTVNSLEQFPQFKGVVDYLKKDPKPHDQIEKEFQNYLKDDWGPKYYFKDIGFDEKWYSESNDFSSWDSIRLPCWWEDAGIGLDKHDGSVWFRTTFDLPANYKDSMFYIDLNLINDYDIAWVNGNKIGQTFGDQNWRQYWVPKRLLKNKDNTLVVRVFDMGGYGGLNFHPLWGNPILTGKWVFKKGVSINPDTIPIPRIVNKSPYSYPTVTYNTMISPIKQAKLTGVIWYQGESNAGRAFEYRNLFPVMISAWRKEFQAPNLPFLYVQLANFDYETTSPENSDWAELREAQDKTLLLPNTGMAVAIDLGDPGDIHPANKKEVGRRLSLLAQKKAYNSNIIAESPRYKSMNVNGDSIIIEVETFGSELVITNKYWYIHGFAIAAQDQKFYWAKAFIRNNKIIVWSEKVKKPIAVRYAWSKNPGKLDIYNAAGLPLAPFRTDTWKGITDDRVFDLNKVFF